MSPFAICHVNLSKGFRGGERQTALLIAELAQRGYRQQLVCRAASPLRDHLSDTPNLSFRSAETPLSGHRLSASCDLLHAHDGRAVHWCLIESALARVPYVVTRRVPNPLKSSFLTRLAYRRAQVVVGLSRAIQHNLESYCSQIRTAVIPSMCAHLPHDEHRVAELKARFDGKFVVGHIGALVNKHKGQSYLIEAARQLAITHPELHFLFLGQGRDEALFRAQSEDLANVEWLGFKSNVGDYLAVMDLFVFPSLEEGLGSILFDVMDYRVPIVASDVDGIPDIIHHERNGLLVPPADTTGLVSAIQRLYHDSALAAHYTQTGADELAQYSPPAIASRYETLYRSVLNY